MTTESRRLDTIELEQRVMRMYGESTRRGA
jgi:hypothetical protein